MQIHSLMTLIKEWIDTILVWWTFHVRPHPEICAFWVRDYLHETAAAAATSTTTTTTTTTTSTTTTTTTTTTITTKDKVIPLQARCGPEGG